VAQVAAVVQVISLAQELPPATGVVKKKKKKKKEKDKIRILLSNFFKVMQLRHDRTKI